MSSRLQRAVDLAAYLSVVANSPETRELAARKRVEASAAIEREQARLEKMRQVLALFPSPVEVSS